MHLNDFNFVVWPEVFRSCRTTIGQAVKYSGNFARRLDFCEVLGPGGTFKVSVVFNLGPRCPDSE